MDKHKILHIAKWYPNKWDIQNGVFIQKHIKATALKHDVLAIAFIENPETTTTEISLVKEDNYAAAIVYHSPLSAFKTIIWKYKTFLRILKEQKFVPDKIHLHVISPDQIIFTHYAIKHKIPYFISEHWSGYVDNRFNQINTIKKRIYRYIAKKATKIFPVTHFLGEGMLASGLKGNYAIIPNVVEVPEFHEVQKKEDFTFMVISDLYDPNKNISGIIRAFDKANLSNSKLHIIGGGPDEYLLKELVLKIGNKNIRFLGRLENKKVLAVLNTAHCLVVNSRFETFSVVILEARGLGLHVIATKCGGPTEIADEDVWLINIDNEKQLIEAIREVSQKKLPKKMNLTNYTAKNIVNQLNKHYSLL